jgi:hypothetical protein
MRDWFRQLQAFEDALAYRRARLAAPCPQCSLTLCDDHATDLNLITSYQQGARRTLRHKPPAAPRPTPPAGQARPGPEAGTA